MCTLKLKDNFLYCWTFVSKFNYEFFTIPVLGLCLGCIHSVFVQIYVPYKHGCLHIAWLLRIWFSQFFSSVQKFNRLFLWNNRLFSLYQHWANLFLIYEFWFVILFKPSNVCGQQCLYYIFEYKISLSSALYESDSSWSWKLKLLLMFGQISMWVLSVLTDKNNFMVHIWFSFLFWKQPIIYQLWPKVMAINVELLGIVSTQKQFVVLHFFLCSNFSLQCAKLFFDLSYDNSSICQENEINSCKEWWEAGKLVLRRIIIHWQIPTWKK